MYRKVDKEQNAQGCINNQVPANRDGAILAVVEEQPSDEMRPTGRKWISSGSLIDSQDSQETSHRIKPKRKRVLVLMGGDRFQRSFNDIFVMNY